VVPRVRALVHHGGIGTSAQALAAGIPQLVRSARLRPVRQRPSPLAARCRPDALPRPLPGPRRRRRRRSRRAYGLGSGSRRLGLAEAEARRLRRGLRDHRRHPERAHR
jgi:hypothetical protein